MGELLNPGLQNFTRVACMPIIALSYVRSDPTRSITYSSLVKMGVRPQSAIVQNRVSECIGRSD
jgi:hypothetical protein